MLGRINQSNRGFQQNRAVLGQSPLCFGLSVLFYDVALKQPGRRRATSSSYIFLICQTITFFPYAPGILNKSLVSLPGLSLL